MRSRYYFRASTWCLLVFSLALTGVAARGEEKGADDTKKSAKTAEADGSKAAKAGGHGHDESDLTHGFAGPSLEAAEEFRADLAIYTVVVFVLLLVVLKVFAWGPIMEGLEKREQGIADKIALAEKNAKEAEARAAEYAAKLSEAAEEAKKVVAEARQDAETARDRIMAEADEARQRDRERFLADIEGAKNAAVGELAEKGADIAVSLAGQIVRREIKAADHAALIKDSLDSFPSNN